MGHDIAAVVRHLEPAITGFMPVEPAGWSKMREDKARLLHSLVIDRTEAGAAAPPSGRRYWPALTAFAVVAIAAIGGAAWFLAPQLLGPGYAEQVAGGEAQRPKIQAQAPPPSSEPRGSLVASGYVVRPRKAAIAR